jgi:hypothetical protein
VLIDAAGRSLPVILTGGHRNDVTRLLPLLNAVPPLRGLRGRRDDAPASSTPTPPTTTTPTARTA